MEIEKKFIDFVIDTKFNGLPKKPVDIVKNIMLTQLGNTVAGATVEPSQNVVDLVKSWGGKEEATILVHGGKVPAYNAVFVNSTMARALDFDDAIIPGLHMGSVGIPTGLAAAEIAGGCSGKEFLTSLVTGIELANRLNLINVTAFYGGFKGTGVCTIFTATAIAGRMLQLNSTQMFNAFGLALNRAGGSQQSNIDGAQAVSLVPGFASQNGIFCVQLAQRGITGPKNFLEGPFGWFKLYGRGKLDPQAIAGELGSRFELTSTIFKKYPSCGLSQTTTEGILDLVKNDGITPDNVLRIDIKMGPFAHNLLGHFEIGESPRVNAQFSVPYCVASALLRKSSEIRHFEESHIRDPRIMDIIKKINMIPDPAVEKRSQGAMEMEVKTKQGAVYRRKIDIPYGFPGKDLTREEHMANYQQCVSYGGKPLAQKNTDKIVSLIEKLEEVEDVRDFIPLMTR
jgi:2-methylcitrate dehydratase PrpD